MPSVDRTVFRLSALALAATAAWVQPAAAQDLSRLQEALAATPSGGWTKVSVGKLSSVFPTGADAVPYHYGSPSNIVPAWSGAVWDSANAQLLLWGGGHANYGGNEMYRWDAASGNWSRGSLPSALVVNDSWKPVVGNGAPVSAHTYAGSAWLPVNQMFITMGGATYPQGGGGGYYDTNRQPTGSWLWDPSKADPNKVGGGNGTGWNPSRAGGDMWMSRGSFATGTAPNNWIHAASVSRVENGKDVVYVTADSYSGGGFGKLYRYEVGDVRNGGTDNWSVVGTMPLSSATGYTYQGAAAIDATRNLFVRTGNIDPNVFDNVAAEDAFIVWDLNKTTLGAGNKSTAVRLVDENGQAISFNSYLSGIDYDSVGDQFVLWSSQDKGKVYTTKPQYDANGQLMSTWSAELIDSTTASQPTLTSTTGVLGKWEYVSELNAFIALEAYAAGDAAVWLYKPLAAVPEPGPAALLALGLLTLQLRRRRMAQRR